LQPCLQGHRLFISHQDDAGFEVGKQRCIWTDFFLDIRIPEGTQDMIPVSEKEL